ncbi:MAG: glycosyltransferase family 4 protein [Candidatus Coatesbacteria bacterium]|nr:glycosyltransferase family 4 protein [Candidatus Coatesbacteria bacterium]
MKKILILTTENLPFFETPVRGGGIRAEMFGEGLKENGFEIIYGFCHDENEKVDYEHENLRFLTPYTSYKVLEEINPDGILSISWYPLLFFHSEIDLPVAVDFHGAVVIENNYKGTVDYRRDFTLKTKALSKADFFTSSAPRGVDMYFFPYLFSADIDPKFANINYIPMGFPQPFPFIKQCSQKEINFIYAGFLWHWKKSEDYVRTIAEFCDKQKIGMVSIFSNEYKEYGGLSVFPLSSRNEVLKKYACSDVGVNLMHQDNETRRGITTVALEMMWSGLPVIALESLQIAEYIRKFDTGWLMKYGDMKTLLRILNEIKQNPEIIKNKGASASRLIAEKFLRKKVIKPLCDFFISPYKLKKRKYISYWQANIDILDDDLETRKSLIISKLDWMKKLSKREKEIDTKIRKLENRITSFERKLPIRTLRLAKRISAYLRKNKSD